jgi:lysophospholipase L1-like esterase
MVHKLKRHRGLIGFLALAVVLFGIAFAFYTFWLNWPEGSGPAGPPVPRAAFQYVWTHRPVLLVGIGDSVTAGFGASDREHSYFRRLVKNPTDDAPEMKGICLSAVLPHLKTLNLSVSGTTSLQHLKIQLPRIPKQKPETLGLVVITTGGNDLIHNYGRTQPEEGAMFGATVAQAKPWIARFETRLDTMLDEIESRFPGGCRIFLADIFDPTDGTGIGWGAGIPSWKDAMPILNAYNAVLARCAKRHPNVHIIPMKETFRGHGITCRQFWRSAYHHEDPTYWYASNFEDPNDRGYDALRRAFLLEMARPFSPGNAGGEIKGDFIKGKNLSLPLSASERGAQRTS